MASGRASLKLVNIIIIIRQDDTAILSDSEVNVVGKDYARGESVRGSVYLVLKGILPSLPSFSLKVRQD